VQVLVALPIADILAGVQDAVEGEQNAGPLY